MASTSVVFPWSTWAMMATLRISGRVRTRAIRVYSTMPGRTARLLTSSCPRFRSKAPGYSLLPAVAALAGGEGVDRAVERRRVEVRPRVVRRPQLGVRGLIEQEVRQPQLAAGAHHEVGIGEPGGPQLRGKGVLVDLLGRERARRDVPRQRAARVAQLRARAVVHRDRDEHRAVV